MARLVLVANSSVGAAREAQAVLRSASSAPPRTSNELTWPRISFCGMRLRFGGPTG